MNTRYFALLGIALFLCIVLAAGPESIITTLIAMNPFYIAISVAISIVAIFLKAVKWKVIVSANGMGIGYRMSFLGWLSGFFIGLVTPGRLGDLARSLYVKSALGRSLSTVVVDRFIDIVILFIFGIAASAAFAAMFGQQATNAALLAAIGAAIVIVAYLFTRKDIVRRIFRPFVGFVVPDRHMHSLRTTFDDFYDSLGTIGRSRPKLAVAVSVGVAGWVLEVVSVYFLALALSMDVPLYFMFIVLPIISILEVLPISISGIGTRDAACIFLFSFLGIGTQASVAFSIMFLAFGLWLFGVIGGLAFLAFPVDLNSYRKQTSQGP